jgi:hypothetical protein
MSLAHESYVDGINPAWGWGSAPRMGTGVNFPTAFDAPVVVPWGIAGTAASGSPATNVRVQIRKMVLDVKRNNTWSRVSYNSSYSSIVGGVYTDYATNTSAPADIRDEGADGISVKLPASGGTFHFYTKNRLSVPFGAQEIVTHLEARLIVDDPSKTDDRSTAKILVNAASDVWRNQTALWSSTVWNNEGIHIGRFKYVDSNWQSFSAGTLQSSTEVDDYLAAEPNLLPR